MRTNLYMCYVCILSVKFIILVNQWADCSPTHARPHLQCGL